MGESNNIVVAFDAYGTLLSTASIAKQLAEHVGEEKAQSIATQWRTYQLEFTWRLTSMNQYEDFSTVTRRSLLRALSEASVTLSDVDITSLMQSYDSLSTFPDVDAALKPLAQAGDIIPVIFSNGTQKMVSASVTKSPDLSPHAHVFKDIVVVEEVRKYKPARETYWHLLEKVGKTKEQAGEVWLVSANPFDIVGARAVGVKAIWVDREGKGWTDTLIAGETGGPTVTVKSLEEVMGVVRKG